MPNLVHLHFRKARPCDIDRLSMDGHVEDFIAGQFGQCLPMYCCNIYVGERPCAPLVSKEVTRAWLELRSCCIELNLYHIYKACSVKLISIASASPFTKCAKHCMDMWDCLHLCPLYCNDRAFSLAMLTVHAKAPAWTSHMALRPLLCIRLICTYTSSWLHQYAPVRSTGLPLFPHVPHLYGSTLSTGVIQSERWSAGATTYFILTRRTSQNCCMVRASRDTDNPANYELCMGPSQHASEASVQRLRLESRSCGRLVHWLEVLFKCAVLVKRSLGP